MNLDFFFDFEEKILINLMNGEELMRLNAVSKSLPRKP